MRWSPLPRDYWTRTASAARLATLRVVVGALGAFGAVRFMANGWVERLIGEPSFFFDYYGLSWVPRLSVGAGYALYASLALAGVSLALGYRTRLSAGLFALGFAWAQALDAANYLNHYYLLLLLAGMCVVLPVGSAYSLDVLLRRRSRAVRVPAWTVHLALVQLSLVYFFAGLAKVNADWLLRAMPLAVWLPERAWWPLVGDLLAQPWTAYLGSWLACAYDLSIWALLLRDRSRPWAYAAVLTFHGFTGLAFNIGLFPVIMVSATLLFFGDEAHERVWERLVAFANRSLALLYPPALSLVRFGGSPVAVATPVASPAFAKTANSNALSVTAGTAPPKWLRWSLGFYLALQVALPLRAYAYPGQLAWTEQGYRFGWRVMLVEKTGEARFTVEDGATGRRWRVDNAELLTPYQEKQMAIQPDFVLQYARHLARVSEQRYSFRDPRVIVDNPVSLNGRRSRRLVLPGVDLTRTSDGLTPSSWLTLAP